LVEVDRGVVAVVIVAAVVGGEDLSATVYGTGSSVVVLGVVQTDRTQANGHPLTRNRRHGQTDGQTDHVQRGDRTGRDLDLDRDLSRGTVGDPPEFPIGHHDNLQVFRIRVCLRYLRTCLNLLRVVDRSQVGRSLTDMAIAILRVIAARMPVVGVELRSNLHPV
jgi:hypothetical protein